MSRKFRRFEILLPLQFNDGRDVPSEWVAEAVLEIVDYFGAASYETQKVEGHWRHSGVLFRDNLVDVKDTITHRRWFKKFKLHWKTRLEQMELWIVSYSMLCFPRRGRRGASYFESGFAREGRRIGRSSKSSPSLQQPAGALCSAMSR